MGRVWCALVEVGGGVVFAAPGGAEGGVIAAGSPGDRGTLLSVCECVRLRLE